MCTYTDTYIQVYTGATERMMEHGEGNHVNYYMKTQNVVPHSAKKACELQDTWITTCREATFAHNHQCRSDQM